MKDVSSLAARLKAAPIAEDPAAAKARLVDLVAEAEGDAATELKRLVKAPASRDLLAGIADHSPYLWRLCAMDPARLARLLTAAPEDALETCLAALEAGCAKAQDQADAMHVLRRAKQESALLIALADLGGVWDAVEVTRALSRFADAAVSNALRVLLREQHDMGRLVLPNLAAPEEGCGVVVLALGKHGACELNYSSDVDLVVFFDPDAPAIPESAEPQQLFVRITKGLVKLLQERTGDGYVLRVDLRLRPDPGSTSVAIALPAAFTYYETLGQNWERAALIKARPVAGDLALGHAFIKDLAPFIWRKYFDYAAIADVHAMKRQIHAVRGHAEVTVPGHDVKLGRGGIREIEFFVQTQQLIFGGRRPHLRGSRTLDMLAELSRDGWVTPSAVTDLSRAYMFLRGIEHRLQMLNDEQTQRLPSDPEALRRFALFCGYKTYEAFADAITAEFRRVESEYARLFEHAPGLDASGGSLVFTGVTDDPDTIETLRNLGFRDPALAAETIRGWHFGRRSAVQSPRAREVLTELVPGLLEAFSGSGDPDAALAAFDTALGKMPAAVELFSILKSNAHVRNLFGDILGGAPRLADVIASRPHVLDAAIDPALIQTSEPDRAIFDRVARVLSEPDSFEAFLDRARHVRHEEMFLIGTRLFSGIFAPGDAARTYTALAEAIAGATFSEVRKAFEADHGRPPGGEAVIVALGKLGSREMTASSDLDLMLIYDFDAEHPESNGARPLHAVQYYTRLTQRLVSALTVPTRAGRLYDVDMRLRPSGRKGPVASQFSGFVSYHKDESETWEQMALTRARCIAGDLVLRQRVEDEIASILGRKRDDGVLRKEVSSMRGLIAQEKGDSDPWDLKLAKGGILDAEFIAQYLVLRHAHDAPGIRDVNTEQALRNARDLDLLAAEQAETLIEALRLMSDVTQLMRITIDGKFDPQATAEGVKRRIASAAMLPDFRSLEADLATRRADVRGIFESVVGKP